LAAQVLLFAVSGLAWQNFVSANAVLPVLDRALAVFSIIWITWLWAFPEPSRPSDAAAVLMTLLLIAATGLALILWAPRSASQPYNLTMDDLLWQGASVALIILGLLTLIVRRPNGFGNGLAMLIFLLIGHAVNFLVPENGNYSGVVRLAYLAAYPILLTIPQRFPAPMPLTAPRAVTADKADNAESRPAEPRRYTAEPKTIHALLALASESLRR
jgi:hypothetical protein